MGISSTTFRRFNVVGSFGLALALTSCFSIYTIDKFNPEKPGGIPFFTKKLVAEQTTTYSLTWLKVSVEAKPASPSPGAGGTPPEGPAPLLKSAVWLVDEHLWNPADVSAAATSATSLEDLRDKLDSSWFLDVKRINDALQLKRGSAPTGLIQFSPLLLSMLSNSFKVIAENDYSQTYQINVDVPVFGSGSAGVKLAADGSLAEASGGVDATGFADVIPLKGLLEKQLGLAEFMAPPPVAAPSLEFNFVVEQQGYLYSLVKKFPATCADNMPKSGCGDAALGQGLSPIPFEPDLYWFQRSRIGPASEPAGTDGKNTASFSGSVKLPSN